MSTHSVYYVPQEQTKFLGREDDVAEKFWKLGLFLETSSGKIMKRLQRRPKFLLPKTKHDVSFSGMGLADCEEPHIVPDVVEGVHCPKCGEDISESFSEAEITPSETEEDLLKADVVCLACNEASPLTEINASPPGFVAAQFYLYVSDISLEDGPWDPTFKATVESVLGPCAELIAEET